MKEIKISKNEANQRFDKYLQKYLKNASKSFIYKMLRKKNITLNLKKADGAEKLNEGDIVRIFFAEETLEKFTNSKICDIKGNPDKFRKRIIYEDDNVLFYNKQIGELSQKSKADDISVNEEFINYLLNTGKITNCQLNTFKPSVCNRLDRNTSGLLICGKSLLGIQTIGKLLKERNIHKYYVCIVKNVITKPKRIEGWLNKDNSLNMVEICDKHIITLDSKDKCGDYICTEYNPICNNGEYTLLEVLLVTGKPHQIRAHLAHIGNPIIGDVKYGDCIVNESFRKQYGLKNQLLHSYRLELPADTGLENLDNKVFIAPITDIFKRILLGVRLDGNLE